MQQIDFTGLAQTLLNRARELLPRWLPGGRLNGNEYQCANTHGGEGQSLRVNIVSGKWADFADDKKGGDLISLYAAIHNIRQIEAAKILTEEIGVAVISKQQSNVVPSDPKLIPPPVGVKAPIFAHHKLGMASNHWEYTDGEGRTLFYVSRHDNEATGKKEFVPWSYSQASQRWVNKLWPKPRPLYNLHELSKRAESHVCIVEGEKAAEAARKIIGNSYVVTTWPSGSTSWPYANWPVIYGRKVLIWPDADAPGLKAAQGIAEVLRPHCAEVKIIAVDKSKSGGWDAADALSEGMNWEQFKSWARPLAFLYQPAVQAEVMPEEIPPPNESDFRASVDITVHESAPAVEASTTSLWIKYDLVLNAKGNAPVNNSDNVKRVLEQDDDFKGHIWFDEFHGTIFTDWNGPVREWSDRELNDLFILMQRKYGLTQVSIGMVDVAMRAKAHNDIRNEPRDWLKSLSWDGVPRVRASFTTYFGATSNPYVDQASENFWISMVARIMEPGCKVDNMVVLEGSQGKYKSTALNVIAGKWFTETNESPNNKDFYLIMRGNLIIEVAELDAFSKADTLTIKKTITCRVDRFRAPFERYVASHPRRCVFVGTTNENEYLNDPTGGRRFWPVTTGTIDLEALRRDREQLFAEALWRFEQGFKWWEMPEETAAVQESRRVIDAWEPIIEDHVQNMKEITTKDIAEQALDLTAGQLDARASRRIGKIMRKLGFEYRSVRTLLKVSKAWVNETNSQSATALPNYAPTNNNDNDNRVQ